MRSERSTEPVEGWRIWNLTEDRTGPWLSPAGSGADRWPRRRPIEARCTVPGVLKPRRKTHTVPDPDCRCGVHASASLEVFARTWPAWPPPPVVGTASLWGRTIEHERGWRSRFAYPTRLRLVCVTCAWVTPGSNTPIVVHRFGRSLYPMCEDHRGGIEVPDGRRTRPTDQEPARLQARLLDAYAVDLLPVEQVEPLCGRPAAPTPPAYMPSIRIVSVGG